MSSESRSLVESEPVGLLASLGCSPCCHSCLWCAGGVAPRAGVSTGSGDLEADVKGTQELALTARASPSQDSWSIGKNNGTDDSTHGQESPRCSERRGG